MTHDQNQHHSRGSTKICSVLFVDIVGYSKKTNSEQIVLKESFVKLWSEAIKEAPPNDIMVVDAGDGAALTSLVEPEDSMRIALKLRELIKAEGERTGEPLITRMGINFGPVQLSTDVHGNSCIVGDAINSAQRIMSFADPGQIMISRSYYDTILPLNREYAEMFCYLGKRADKHIRYHDVYAIGQGGGTLGQVADTPSFEMETLSEVPEAIPAAPAATTQEPPKAPAYPEIKKPSLLSRVASWFGTQIGKIFFIAKLAVLCLVIYELIVLVPIIQKPELVKGEVNSQILVVKQTLLGVKTVEETLSQPSEKPRHAK